VFKSKILTAVAQAKVAVQDLAVVVSHIKRGAAVHVPGTAPSHSETFTAVSIVFTRFEAREVDQDRIQASDWRGLVFPETGLSDFNTNDIIRVPSGLQDITAGDYRIVNDEKVMAGDAVALHQLQLRKL
jgi:hypothetical protein